MTDEKRAHDEAFDSADDALESGIENESADATATAAEHPGELADSLRRELNDARERALRSQAELDNFRKRARREMDDERKYANVGLLRDLLSVVDNVGRAVEAAEKSADTSGGLLDGVRLVGQQLETVLARYHCTKMDALYQPFDPNVHEAVMQQPSSEYGPGTVLQVLQAGYQLHDRVVRPAQVIVSTAAPTA